MQFQGIIPGAPLTSRKLAFKVHSTKVWGDVSRQWASRHHQRPSATGVADGQTFSNCIISELFAFAGIWDRWKDPSGNTAETCAILTTTPNALTSAVHDRMPVILDPDVYDLWLDPGMKDVSAASELLKPFDARLMRISTRINHVANDDEKCSAPGELAQIQNPLFSCGL